MENIAVVLHEPHFPENIGAAARAAKNMGVRRLIVVNPRDCDLTRILKMATHTAEDVVADMEIHDTLDDALAPFGHVVGTTARTGSHRQTVRSPRRLAEDLIPVSQENLTAILFGTETRGLANDELKYCHSLVTIPTADFSSLNLAQAVMIMLYEIFLAGTEDSKVFIPRLATTREMEGMYSNLKETLARIKLYQSRKPRLLDDRRSAAFSTASVSGREKLK